MLWSVGIDYVKAQCVNLSSLNVLRLFFLNKLFRLPWSGAIFGGQEGRLVQVIVLGCLDETPFVWVVLAGGASVGCVGVVPSTGMGSGCVGVWGGWFVWWLTVQLLKARLFCCSGVGWTVLCCVASSEDCVGCSLFGSVVGVGVGCLLCCCWLTGRLAFYLGGFSRGVFAGSGISACMGM